MAGDASLTAGATLEQAIEKMTVEMAAATMWERGMDILVLRDTGVLDRRCPVRYRSRIEVW
ncbi:MAG: hypothetical protein ACM3VU_00425 [Arthrospira platensis]